jgi:hypothetical protein
MAGSEFQTWHPLQVIIAGLHGAIRHCHPWPSDNQVTFKHIQYKLLPCSGVGWVVLIISTLHASQNRRPRATANYPCTTKTELHIYRQKRIAEVISPEAWSWWCRLGTEPSPPRRRRCLRQWRPLRQTKNRTHNWLVIPFIPDCICSEVAESKTSLYCRVRVKREGEDWGGVDAPQRTWRKLNGFSSPPPAPPMAWPAAKSTALRQVGGKTESEVRWAQGRRAEQ